MTQFIVENFWFILALILLNRTRLGFIVALILVLTKTDIGLIPSVLITLIIFMEMYGSDISSSVK